MAAPIVDYAAGWAHGSNTFTFRWHDNLRFTGTRHPAGCALRVNPSSTIDDGADFIQTHGRDIRDTATGFICASRPTSFDKVQIGEVFECDPILIMGATCTDHFPPESEVYYYKLKSREDLVITFIIVVVVVWFVCH